MSVANGGWSDPADYGYEDLPRVNGIAVIPNLGPDEVRCRACGHVAIEHTVGEFSIYGMCPGAEPIQPLRWEGDEA